MGRGEARERPGGTRAARARLREVAGTVNPVGRAVLVLGVLALAVAVHLHWRELAVLGATFVLVVSLCLPYLVGRTRVRVDLVLEPDRLVAGGSVAASLSVTNLAPGRLRGTTLDLPVGPGVHRYALPGLGAGRAHEEAFTIRTEHRGVIVVGPATTRRGDPLGLCSRDVTWTERSEILVRPAMAPLESLGAGLLRDLEGVATDAISQSDLAFHALREYVPGDDLRHVHWRSSAKAMASGGENQLLVRQYLDTRRSHASLVVDDEAGSWVDPDGFETAMSVAASVIVRAILDDFETSFVCGAQSSTGVDGQRALDAVCRATTGHAGLTAGARAAAVAAPGTSLLFLVGGPRTEFATFRRASAAFPPEIRRFAIVVDRESTTGVTDVGGLPVLHLAALEDLGGLLRWSLR